jgi:ribonuclease HI
MSYSTMPVYDPVGTSLSRIYKQLATIEERLKRLEKTLPASERTAVASTEHCPLPPQRKDVASASDSIVLPSAAVVSREASLKRPRPEETEAPKKAVVVDAKPESPKYLLRFDGASKGNPGPSGAGWVLYKNGHEAMNGRFYLDSYSTNNEAEYQGLLQALKHALPVVSADGVRHLTVEGDSTLVVKQVRGEYKCNVERLRVMRDEILDLMATHAEVKVNLVQIPRESNARADQLSNDAVTSQSSVVSTYSV